MMPFLWLLAGVSLLAAFFADDMPMDLRVALLVGGLALTGVLFVVTIIQEG